MTDTTGTMGAWKVRLETECGTVDADGWDYPTEAEAWEAVAGLAKGMAGTYGSEVTVRLVVEYDPTDDQFLEGSAEEYEAREERERLIRILTRRGHDPALLVAMSTPELEAKIDAG